MILGLDVGGANTKFASSDGKVARIEYLPLWKEAPLEALLRRASEEIRPAALGVVMTGELADCFPDKLSGITHIKEAVERSFSCPIRFWGVNGFVQEDLCDLAAANWSASAAFLSVEVGDCIFVDMGSTTTDLIPIKGGSLAAATDFERLARGELIYSGLLRTNLAALLSHVRIEGRKVPLSSELFAVTADAYRVLGEISDEGYTVETPDGAGKDRFPALRRLARTVCGDLDEIGKLGALEIACQAKECQLGMLMESLDQLAKKHGLERVVAAGIGERLIEDAAGRLGLGCIPLSDRYGAAVSDAFPAYAVARLVELEG